MYIKVHYYSPYPDLDYIESSYNEDLLEVDNEAIQLNEDLQIDLLNKFAKTKHLIKIRDEQSNSHLYYQNNVFFRFADAWIYASFMSYYKPGTIIEIGSGFSTALSVDINNEINQNKTHINAIDPNPKRLKDLIKHKRECLTIYENSVLEFELNYFKQLKKNDILFVDSSHVLKQGSELNYILFKILPTLNRGVIIHFHDIFLFNYPKSWYLQGRAWNEAFALKAFLSYNNSFKILFLNKFITTKKKEICKNVFPELLRGHGGSSMYILKT